MFGNLGRCARVARDVGCHTLVSILGYGSKLFDGIASEQIAFAPACD
jgi:hypothetical protein